MTRPEQIVCTRAEHRRRTLAFWATMALTALIVGLGAAADLGGWFVG